MLRRDTLVDVAIVGGGPAGLAAAIAARMAGLTVAVAEAQRPPVDKACGEGIMPDGLRALARLGVEIPAAQGAPFRGIRFLDSESQASAEFPEGEGKGIRRTALHELLTVRAEDVGVKLFWGAPVTAVNSSGMEAGGQRIRSRWVVGADGPRSRVAAAAGILNRDSGRSRFGFREHYRVKPWTLHVEVYWSEVGQVYVTPIAPDEICVALITRRQDVRLPAALQHFPALRNRLSGAESLARLRGAVTATRRLSRLHRGNFALIGEASGSVDAVTGEGLSLCFQQAVALAEALRSDNFLTYERAHRRIQRLPLIMSEVLLMMDRNPGLRRRALKALSRNPALFGKLLDIHVGAAPPQSLGLRGGLALGWGLLTATEEA